MGEPFKYKILWMKSPFGQWQSFSISKRSHCPANRTTLYAKPQTRVRGYSPAPVCASQGSYPALTELSYLNTNWLNPRTSSSPLQWVPLNCVAMTSAWGKDFTLNRVTCCLRMWISQGTVGKPEIKGRGGTLNTATPGTSRNFSRGVYWREVAAYRVKTNMAMLGCYKFDL